MTISQRKQVERMQLVDKLSMWRAKEKVKPIELEQHLFQTIWTKCMRVPQGPRSGMKSTGIFVYWNKRFHTSLLCTICRYKKNPEQIPAAWLKPGLKRDKQLEDNLLHTQFTVGWGIFFSFFSLKHRKEVTEYTSAAATMPFSSKKRWTKRQAQPYSHVFGSKPCYISLRVIFAALMYLVFSFSPSPRKWFIHKQDCQTTSWGQSGKLSSRAPWPEVPGQAAPGELGASSSSEAHPGHLEPSALLTRILREREIPPNVPRPSCPSLSKQDRNRNQTQRHKCKDWNTVVHALL